MAGTKVAISCSSAASVPADAVRVAHALADAAGEVCRHYFRTPTLAVDSKSDASPVTVADRQAEQDMRAILREAFPTHGIYGEEAGLEGPAADLPPGGPVSPEYVWVLDPIDGTKSFITGKPLFGILIALLHKGTPVLGIIDQPILRERWLGMAGAASSLNGAPISVRPCAALSDAYLYATTPHMFSGRTVAPFERVRDQARMPMYGCDCYAYGLLAAGLCDVVIEADLKPWDYAALVPIIQGAGGRITDWEGLPLRWEAPPPGTPLPATGMVGEVLAAGDPAVHAEALRVLAWRNKE